MAVGGCSGVASSSSGLVVEDTSQILEELQDRFMLLYNQFSEGGLDRNSRLRCLEQAREIRDCLGSDEQAFRDPEENPSYADILREMFDDKLVTMEEMLSSSIEKTSSQTITQQIRSVWQGAAVAYTDFKSVPKDRRDYSLLEQVVGARDYFETLHEMIVAQNPDKGGKILRKIEVLTGWMRKMNRHAPTMTVVDTSNLRSFFTKPKETSYHDHDVTYHVPDHSELISFISPFKVIGAFASVLLERQKVCENPWKEYQKQACDILALRKQKNQLDYEQNPENFTWNVVPLEKRIETQKNLIEQIDRGLSRSYREWGYESFFICHCRLTEKCQKILFFYSPRIQDVTDMEEEGVGGDVATPVITEDVYYSSEEEEIFDHRTSSPIRTTGQEEAIEMHQFPTEEGFLFTEFEHALLMEADS